MMIPNFTMPIGSMYGIFTYIWVIYGANVGKYSSTMDPMGWIWVLWTIPNLEVYVGWDLGGDAGTLGLVLWHFGRHLHCWFRGPESPGAGRWSWRLVRW